MSINEIGFQWKFAVCGDYVVLDIHNNNFHPGMHKWDSPKYAKVMYRKDGSRYIRYNKKTWFID